MKIKLLFINIFLLSSFTGYSQNVKSDSLLKVLKAELARENFYDLKKGKQINRLRNRLQHTDSANFEVQYDLCSQLSDQYHSFKFDSAFAYVKKMIDLSVKFQNKEKLIHSEILLGTVLINTGFYKEAFEVTEKIDTNCLSNSLKTDYLVLHARLNAGIGDYDNDAYFSKQYYKQSADDFKSAETVTPSNEFEKTINLAFLPESEKSSKLTPQFFYNTIMQRRLPEHGIAMVATRISYAYSGENRIFFLALATLNDIRSATKETLAVFLLGQELFKLNRTADAYIFMQEAAKNAKFYGTRNRAVQIESILPVVASKLIDEKQHERDKLLIGILIFMIVAVLLFFLLVIYRKQILRIKANEQEIKAKNKELESVNGKLWEASKIKEELIGLFFKTCSSYIETLDKVKRKTQRNIKLGKYNDANAVLNNVRIEQEKGQLFNTLDTVFLTMFPNFIDAFNGLLKPEDQVWPKNGETLNATLRIFALMRLGIDDLEVIAKILDYSLSTVYTYKMRIKSKALVPADIFEQQIMDIKFIDSRTAG
ncbi:DUF6377 domain-containing protein [Mucilaginibacter aquaedulcis]|uniref:DUF6377 domain-containing protein n=1 Tax=Mucilaginibacter aquaedulcis TaxID=1187081 RepID=UPI0025B396B2|nr:DUF6377 domain-containing protein [Mucilaginibacter aquaedulcis]MDN3551051.1 DUF6377 domain-containing protein [Mucilaginibacter aquaedulcis]